MNKKALSILAVLLAGLMALQFIWMYRAVSANRQIFVQKTGLITNDLNRHFRSQRESDVRLRQLLRSPDKGALTTDIWKSPVDSIVSLYGLPLNYQYGLYRHTPTGFVFEQGNYSEGALLHTCPATTTINLSCTSGSLSNIHLILHYPNQLSSLLGGTLPLLVASVLLACIFVVLFSFILRDLRRHRRLSDMKYAFINTVSHELKTPVFSLSMASQLLKTSLQHRLSEKRGPLSECD